MRGPLLLLILALGACSRPGGPYPSLQPRSTEAIDPRVAVVRPLNSRPVSPALANRLSALIEEAQSGDLSFAAAASNAERLAALAGAPKSESWIAAEESLTAAIAARKLTSSALGEIDEIGATALQTQGGLSPNDLAAIDRAAEEVASIDRRQADRIIAIQKRLGA